MAGDWIKMRASLRSHPKIVRIASALKADKLHVIGGLFAVWCLFDEHSEDGQLVGYTPSALDREVGFPGFSDLLIGVGWLQSDGNDGLSLPEFETHNGASAKRRAQEADRKRAGREASAIDTQSVRSASASDADKKRTREEKRRVIPEANASGSSAKPRASKRCPEEFLVEAELQKWARDNVPLVDIRAETANFRDYEFPKGKTDWPATWRVWMRKEQKRLAEVAARRPGAVASLTVPSRPADPDSALEQMKRDVMTPEEKAAAEKVRTRVMATIKRVAA